MSTIKHQETLRASYLWKQNDEFATSDARRVIINGNGRVNVDNTRVIELLRGMVRAGELYQVSRGKYKLSQESLISIPWRTVSNEKLGTTRLASGWPL